MRFAFGVQKWHKFNNHMDRKHIKRRIRLSCQLSVPLYSLWKMNLKLTGLIGPVFHEFLHICGPGKYNFFLICGPWKYNFCENMNDFEVTNKILYHYANTRFSNGGSVNITVSFWMTVWFLPAGWNKKLDNFESKWPKEFFFDWSRFFIWNAFDGDCHFISQPICKFIY